MQAIFLDIETTGLDPQIHRAIDIAFRIVNFDDYHIVTSYQSIIKQQPHEWLLHDPVSLRINGYTWNDVCEGNESSIVSEEIKKIFSTHNIVRGSSFFICQNPAFDRVFITQLIPIPIQEELQWPYHWLDLASMHWALLQQKCHLEKRALPSKLSLSKNEIAERYNIPSESLPHRAMNGVDHLIACYEAVFKIKFVEREQVQNGRSTETV